MTPMAPAHHATYALSLSSLSLRLSLSLSLLHSNPFGSLITALGTDFDVYRQSALFVDSRQLRLQLPGDQQLTILTLLVQCIAFIPS
jgi:hypothetical protein